jgi:hypothetical protein
MLYMIKTTFHLWGRTCDSCLSEGGLFQLMWWDPVLFIYFQMPNFIFSCIYHIFFIHSSVEGHLGLILQLGSCE